MCIPPGYEKSRSEALRIARGAFSEAECGYLLDNKDKAFRHGGAKRAGWDAAIDALIEAGLIRTETDPCHPE